MSKAFTLRRKPKDQNNPKSSRSLPSFPQEWKSTELYEIIEPNIIGELQDNLLKAQDVELK
jgi:hypothetical protein